MGFALIGTILLDWLDFEKAVFAFHFVIQVVYFHNCLSQESMTVSMTVRGAYVEGVL